MEARLIKIAVADTWTNTRATIHNWRARWQPTLTDYILISLAGEMPEFIPPPPPWVKWLPTGFFTPPSGWSLNGLRYAFDDVARDPRPVGVLLNLSGLNVGWATAQSLRDLISRLRKKKKKVVVYSAYYDIIDYYVATAADVILAPKPAMWDVTGLRVELTFLKDAFAAWGVQAEVVNVSPYKTAWDTYARNDISPEHRAMIEWMMDGRFEILVEAIAQSRKLEPARVRELIDGAPYLAEAARERGLFDAILYEDELAEYLGPDHKAEKPSRFKFNWKFWKKEEKEEKTPAKPKATLKRWGQVWSALLQPIRWRSGKRIGIIPIEGVIIPGRSQSPPIPALPIPIPLPFVDEPMAGSETIAQHLRDAEKDDAIAAVVMYVNSGGGSALASDLIWRDVERVRRRKPVVVYMGNVAASGGYYVAATTNHIVAQPLTITGSIGVVSLKFVTAGLYEKFKANRVVIKRGANVGLYADDAPFTPELRAVAEAQADAYYTDFKRVVISGRNLEEPALEEVAGGRVWLGQQALGHKLIDQLGDLQVAIDQARALAKVAADKWTPHVWYTGTGGNLLPPPFPATPPSPANYVELARTFLREQVWMISPFKIK